MELTLEQLYKILTHDEVLINWREISDINFIEVPKTLDITLDDGSHYRVLEPHLVDLVITNNAIEVMAVNTGEVISINIYEFLQGEHLREKIEELIYVDNKLNIPWGIIDPKWGSAAMNKDGSVVLFKGSFTAHLLRDETMWFTQLNESILLTDHISVSVNHVEDWEKTLTIRL